MATQKYTPIVGVPQWNAQMLEKSDMHRGPDPKAWSHVENVSISSLRGAEDTVLCPSISSRYSWPRTNAEDGGI
ncbi:hypothetical protein PILCRDRAFT_826123 [Piloderma croceum F 1598]|uniref:Uncharacterized protein n=1 Tax=Piloderma croceum (strain F 1598) TaxID=765440 RepID=A0A0C3AS39_PILCF|nr:hypothetical protein PILCRDRAFT_826123 [Piloderma croceum F 1598]